jgi:hypothetical protein
MFKGMGHCGVCEGVGNIIICEMAALVVSARLSDFSRFVWGFPYKLGTRLQHAAALEFSLHRRPPNWEIC